MNITEFLFYINGSYFLVFLLLGFFALGVMHLQSYSHCRSEDSFWSRWANHFPKWPHEKPENFKDMQSCCCFSCSLIISSADFQVFSVLRGENSSLFKLDQLISKFGSMSELGMQSTVDR